MRFMLAISDFCKLTPAFLYYNFARSCFFDKVFLSNRKATKIAEEIKSKGETKSTEP